MFVSLLPFLFALKETEMSPLLLGELLIRAFCYMERQINILFVNNHIIGTVDQKYYKRTGKG